MKSRLLPVFVVLPALVCSALSADLVSRSTSAATDLSGGGNSSTPAMSADGRWIVFLSHAANLVTNDDRAEWLDVFARDLINSNTVLVSVNLTGVGGGNWSSGYASVSSNGQFIAFASEAGNLIANDANNASDVFVRDLTSETTRLVSATVDGMSPNVPAVDLPNAERSPLSTKPMITAEGGLVFFESRATSLTARADLNLQTDVFVRDLRANANHLISIAQTSPRTANGRSVLSSITPDGRKVAFVSTSTDLVAGDANPLGDVYVRDLGTSGGATGVTFRASAGVTNYASSYRCLSASLSEDGRFVAFAAEVASTHWLFRHHLESGTTLVVSSNHVDRSGPQISADGRYIAFDDGRNVYRWDGDSSNVVAVNVTTNGVVPGLPTFSRTPIMDATGNGIVFLSDAPALGNSSTGFVFQIHARDMIAGNTRLVSARPNGTASTANHESSSIAVARDVSMIAFDSPASDLVNGDGNRANDVFVRNRSAATTTLASARHSALPRTSGLGHAYVAFGGINSNGHVVAFTSFNSDFAPDDTNNWSDVFVRNEAGGMTRGVGIRTNASMLPMLSLDGRYIVYLRGEGGGSAFGWARVGDVHRLDLKTGVDVALTTNSSLRPAISADGRYVACQGRLSSFSFTRVFRIIDVDGGTNLWETNVETVDSIRVGDEKAAEFTPDSRFAVYRVSGDLFAFDLLTLSNRVLTNVIGIPNIALSGNSRFVAIGSMNVFGPVVVYDLIARTMQNLPLGYVRHLSLSEDGRHLVAETAASIAGPYQVVRVDRQTGATNLVTINTSGTGPAEGNRTVPMFPQISADARYVVFHSAATNLVLGDTNGRADIFVRDLGLGSTTRIALGMDGGDANAAVSRPILAADGRTVVFHSVASDIVPGDYNDKRDIFILKLGGADTDGDGLDDDWEVAYFGNLSRNGSGDFDADGQTDLREFHAGTDPTNSDSIFRVLTVTPLGGGGTRILWNASPGRAYRVEFKNAVTDANWTVLDGAISWSGSTASVIDQSASNPQRFYRVVRLP